MPIFNLNIFANAYSDANATNSPSFQNFRIDRSLNGYPALNPISNAFSLAPGASQILFSGTRTLDQDGTTQYSISLLPMSSNTYVLTAVGGTLPNFRIPRSTRADATTEVSVTLNGPLVTFSAPSVGLEQAFFTGTIGGMATSVEITANNPGTAGNSIVIPPDGTSNVIQLIANWNTANPLNQVSLTSGDGTQIPTGGEFTFSGGTNTTPFSLISGGVVVGDNVSIGSLFSIQNQGQYQIIALTATSFTINNPNGIAQGPVILGSGFASQVSIYSAAGVQIGDTLDISGGFSSVTQGSYQITGVGAEFLQFYTTSILPIEGPITTDDIAVYSSVKNFIYMEADQYCQVSINGNPSAQIQPFINTTDVTPGIFMLKSTMFEISITNNSINTANIYFAAVE